MSQFRLVVRRLLRTPLFALVCVLTLALGIGASTAVFSVVNGILLKPLPYPDPERLLGVWYAAPGLGFDRVPQSPANYLTTRNQGQVFQDIGIWNESHSSITGLQAPHEVNSMFVTDGILPLLGVDALIGRRFSREDDLSTSPPTVMLSFAYWKERFGGDPKVLGRTLTVDGVLHEIIGVTPAGFRFLSFFDPAVLLPLRLDPNKVVLGNFSYPAVARLKDGVTLEQAAADMARLIPLTVEQFPGGISLSMLEEARFAPSIHPLKQDVVGDIGSVLWVLLGTVGIVFLVACANVANLFLVRSEARHLELAIRSALGAGSRRIAGEIFSESVALGLLGGILGLGLAAGSLRLLIAFGPTNLPRLSEIGLDIPTLLVALGLSLAAGILFGALPALKLAHPNLFASLKDGSRGSSEGSHRQRARSLLVVAQVAMALTLLIGSGLMLRTFEAMRAIEPGFVDPDHVLTFSLFLPESEVAGKLEVARTHDRIRQQILSLPGVRSVGLTSGLPMANNDNNDALFVEDFPTPEGQVPPIRRMRFVSPEYLPTLGTPLVAGRIFDWGDVWNHRNQLVISENLAREYWETPQQALGKRVRRLGENPWYEIVGVVGDIYDDGVAKPAVPTAYWPLITNNSADPSQITTYRSLAYAIRSPRVVTADFQEEVRRAVWSVNPNLPLANVRFLSELLRSSMSRTSFTLLMLGISGAVALLLGMVGIYGVVSYGVSQRLREIGVRVALGATRRDVSFLVLRRGLILTLAGIAVGSLTGLAVTRFLAGLLFGVDPLDPITFASVSTALTLVSLLASYLPARRASRIDPIEALR